MQGERSVVNSFVVKYFKHYIFLQKTLSLALELSAQAAKRLGRRDFLCIGGLYSFSNLAVGADVAVMTVGARLAANRAIYNARQAALYNSRASLAPTKSDFRPPPPDSFRHAWPGTWRCRRP
jgi:hypothetical protein